MQKWEAELRIFACVLLVKVQKKKKKKKINSLLKYLVFLGGKFRYLFVWYKKKDVLFIQFLKTGVKIMTVEYYLRIAENKPHFQDEPIIGLETDNSRVK